MLFKMSVVIHRETSDLLPRELMEIVLGYLGRMTICPKSLTADVNLRLGPWCLPSYIDCGDIQAEVSLALNRINWLDISAVRTKVDIDLSEMPCLEHLQIENIMCVNPQWVNGLDNLRRIKVMGFKEIHADGEISFLRRLPAIERVSLHEIYASVSIVGGRSLRYLSVWNVQEPLCILGVNAGLQEIHFKDTHGNYDLSGLPGTLRRLNITNLHSFDLKHLGLSRLKLITLDIMVRRKMLEWIGRCADGIHKNGFYWIE